MLKTILNLDGVKGLSKSEQKDIQGGLSILIGFCDTTCARLPHPPSGTTCGTTNSPGRCDGRGGFRFL